MTLSRLVPIFAACTATLLVAPPALADSTRLGLDLQYGWPINEAGVDHGPGGALRLGKQLDLVALQLTGEIGGGYQTFAGPARLKLYSGFIGGRISVGKILEPGIYGHVGVGHLTASAGDASRTAPDFDAGLFLDLTLLPLVNVGVHGGYDYLAGSNGAGGFDYAVAGVHAALVF